MIKMIAAAMVAALALTFGAGSRPAQAHTSDEIRSAAQSWVDHGAPYDQLTADSQRLVSRSTWTAWSQCGGSTTGKFTASVRGYGNDLAVVRFTFRHSTAHTEWTAFYRDGRWTFRLPGVDVQRIHSHTAAQLASCAS